MGAWAEAQLEPGGDWGMGAGFAWLTPLMHLGSVRLPSYRNKKLAPLAGTRPVPTQEGGLLGPFRGRAKTTMNRNCSLAIANGEGPRL
jgi:hypothetical protein